MQHHPWFCALNQCWDLFFSGCFHRRHTTGRTASSTSRDLIGVSPGISNLVIYIPNSLDPYYILCYIQDSFIRLYLLLRLLYYAINSAKT